MNLKITDTYFPIIQLFYTFIRTFCLQWPFLFLRRIRWSASSTDFVLSVSCSLKLSVSRSDVTFRPTLLYPSSIERFFLELLVEKVPSSIPCIEGIAWLKLLKTAKSQIGPTLVINNSLKLGTSADLEGAARAA